MAWWCDRLRTGSRLDAARGMVFEQRWADLMPGMFEQVGLLRDPGFNSGYWRAATSHFERTGTASSSMDIGCGPFTSPALSRSVPIG